MIGGGREGRKETRERERVLRGGEASEVFLYRVLVIYTYLL